MRKQDKITKKKREEKRGVWREDCYGFFNKLAELTKPIDRDDYKVYYIPSRYLVNDISDYGRGYYVVRIWKTINKDNPVRFNILSVDDSGATAFGESTFEQAEELIKKYYNFGFPPLEELEEECDQIGLFLERW